MENRSTFGTILIAGAIALIAVGIAFFTTSSEKEGAAVSTVHVVNEVGDSNVASASDALLDDDGDGLVNWKETLWGTDPKNPDSDGDGTLDGEEVALGANPNKEGVEPVTGDEYEAPKSLPATEALARELFTTYASVRRDGVITEEEVNVELSEILKRRVREEGVGELFELNSLSIESDINLTAYEGSLNAALRKASAVREYELNVFARAVSGKSSELAKLAITALVYQDIRDLLLKIEVPEEVANEHLALVNSISNLSYATDRLSTWSGDPLDALVLVNGFAASEDEMNASMEDLFTLTQILKRQS